MRPEELGEDLEGRVAQVRKVLLEHLLDAAGKRGLEHVYALPELLVRLREQLDAGDSEVERVAASAEGVPAKVAVPRPVQVRAVVFLEGHAATAGAIAAAEDFGVVQHDPCLPG